jgi:hypothetical protein
MRFKFQPLVPIELESGPTGLFVDFIKTNNFGDSHKIGIIFNGLICYRHHDLCRSRLGWVMANTHRGREIGIVIVSDMRDKAAL